MGSVKSKSAPGSEKENDETVRETRVYYVLNRPGTIAHWSVVFEFDYFYVQIEAFPDGDKLFKKLKPVYSKTTTKPEGDFTPMSEPMLFFNADFMLNPAKMVYYNLLPKIKTVKLSPKTIYNLCHSNSHNGSKYILGIMDCQVWAMTVAQDLEPYKIK